MVTIELVAKCDYCEASEAEKMDYVSAITKISTFLKRLRAKGWEFHYDQGWKLTLTICPVCAIRKVRQNGEKR